MGDDSAPAQPVYENSVAGQQSRLNDFLKGVPDRKVRDEFLANARKGIYPTDARGVVDYQSDNIRNSYENWNYIEDSIRTDIETRTKTDATRAEADRIKALTTSTALRDQDLKRKNALEGAQNSQGVVNRAGSSAAVPSTILSSPLGQVGGYLGQSKSILGS